MQYFFSYFLSEPLFSVPFLLYNRGNMLSKEGALCRMIRSWKARCVWRVFLGNGWRRLFIRLRGVLSRRRRMWGRLYAWAKAHELSFAENRHVLNDVIRKYVCFRLQLASKMARDLSAESHFLSSAFEGIWISIRRVL